MVAVRLQFTVAQIWGMKAVFALNKFVVICRFLSETEFKLNILF